MGLRTIAVVALAGWAGWLLFRGVVRRRVPWVGLAVLAVPLVLLGWTERQWVSAENVFSAVARTVEPVAPGVHCQRIGESFLYAGAEAGHVEYDADGVPTGPAWLSYGTCTALAQYWRSSASEKSGPSLEEVMAVHVLSHESYHLAGVRSESVAECDAMQRDARTAQALGASPLQARQLATTYWLRVFPDMPPDYRSPDCREGGRLDKTPGDGVWP
ncbi:MAG: hypothetical protein GC157_07390 [Frankiales bacterium]|nr:hypothetical protein [Frankiales bacterium]